ncbi:MAG TPA: preprotein translocase subunit SecG [Candidatus Dormibacteraeota bacterium]|nr:preprotein translocase subunit SecG [Candidatus Dormibacteraeota bacterium]
MPFWAKWGVSILVGIGLVSLGWRFTVMLVTLHVLVCFLLIIVVMLQSGTAADLAGAFGGAGSQTAFGPRGAATFLSRATTWCAIVFMMTSMALSVKRAGPNAAAIGSLLENTNTPTQSAPPTTPAKAPAPASKPAPAAPKTPVQNAPAHK